MGKRVVAQAKSRNGKRFPSECGASLMIELPIKHDEDGEQHCNKQQDACLGIIFMD